ncbi:MAG: APC family permease, partial [Elusimicrobiales bacterium]|nr:APC family permease [Elusimicrobiales bacterium]
FSFSFSLNPRGVAVIFSLCVIYYFWRENIKGVKESSENNIKIVIFTGIVGFLLLIFSIYTIYKRGYNFPPFEFRFTDESLGWAKNFDFLKPIGIIGVLMALGHSILALSGLETLAQVYREIEDPKIPNLKKAVFIIFIFSFLFTGVLTFFTGLIIPFDKIVNNYYENLLSGLAMELAVPFFLKIFLKFAVVLSAFFMLIGAVNTAIVGANGIMNRVAEDGILPSWMRKLHPKYGTTYIIISTVALLQGIIVILSGGDIFILGEAYAFGVLWSLTFDLASLIVLRFKRYDLKKEWMFPLNIEWKRYKIPLGLILLFILIFSLSIINLFTKKVATMAGVSFSLFLYFLFTYSEKKQQSSYFDIHKINETDKEEKVNIKTESNIESLFKNLTKKNRILVAVRNPNNLVHLRWVFENVNDEDTDIVVLNVKVEKGYNQSSNYETLTLEEKDLFREIILMAEKYGKTIHPVVVYSNEPVYTILTCALVGCFSRIVMGVSGTLGAETQMEDIALMWGMIRPKNFNSNIEVNIIWESRRLSYILT